MGRACSKSCGPSKLDRADLWVLGYAVEFDPLRGDVIVLPPDRWIVHDRSGLVLRKCDVFIVPRVAPEKINSSSATRAKSYDAAGKRHMPGGFLIPTSGYVRWARVKEIRYTRPAGEGKFHPYLVPVTLFSHPAMEAYKLHLPEGCDVDAGGFRYP